MVNERIQRRIERLLDQIDTVEASGDWQKVIELARDVLAIDDENREALSYVRTAERRLGASPDSEDESTAARNVIAPPHNQPITQPAPFSDGRYKNGELAGG